MKKITTLYCIISLDHDTQEEQICAWESKEGGLVPFISTDRKEVEKLFNKIKKERPPGTLHIGTFLKNQYAPGDHGMEILQ